MRGFSFFSNYFNFKHILNQFLFIGLLLLTFLLVSHFFLDYFLYLQHILSDAFSRFYIQGCFALLYFGQKNYGY